MPSHGKFNDFFIRFIFTPISATHGGSHQNIQLTKNLYSIISHLTKTNAELVVLVSSTTTKTVISGQENQTNTRCINKKLHR